MHFASKSLERNNRPAFLSLWSLTIILGGLFLFGTGREWHGLIYEHGLTISTNLFGTTYYSLVGLHAFHVSAGLIMLTIVLIFGLAGRCTKISPAVSMCLRCTGTLLMPFGSSFSLWFTSWGAEERKWQSCWRQNNSTNTPELHGRLNRQRRLLGPLFWRLDSLCYSQDW